MNVENLDDRIGLAADQRAAICAAIAEHHTLESVARFRPIVDVVTQDEYTHDVIVCWADNIYIVYDAT